MKNILEAARHNLDHEIEFVITDEAAGEFIRHYLYFLGFETVS
jgi:hypothetical protein